jgi:secretion/DNA translocation related TadE-like protein
VRATRPRDERGAAVVVAIGLIGLLTFVAAVCVGAEAIVLGHRRAQVAADLAALAGAGALQRGVDACAAADRIAERHEAVLTRCVVDGQTVEVSTSIALPLALGGADLPARARAGPQNSNQ